MRPRLRTVQPRAACAGGPEVDGDGGVHVCKGPGQVGPILPPIPAGHPLPELQSGSSHLSSALISGQSPGRPPCPDPGQPPMVGGCKVHSAAVLERPSRASAQGGNPRPFPAGRSAADRTGGTSARAASLCRASRPAREQALAFPACQQAAARRPSRRSQELGAQDSGLSSRISVFSGPRRDQHGVLDSGLEPVSIRHGDGAVVDGMIHGPAIQAPRELLEAHAPHPASIHSSGRLCLGHVAYPG